VLLCVSEWDRGKEWQRRRWSWHAENKLVRWNLSSRGGSYSLRVHSISKLHVLREIIIHEDEDHDSAIYRLQAFSDRENRENSATETQARTSTRLNLDRGKLTTRHARNCFKNLTMEWPLGIYARHVKRLRTRLSSQSAFVRNSSLLSYFSKVWLSDPLTCFSR